MNRTPTATSIDWKKVFLAILIVAILGYQWYQNQGNLPQPPMGEQRELIEKGTTASRELGTAKERIRDQAKTTEPQKQTSQRTEGNATPHLSGDPSVNPSGDITSAQLAGNQSNTEPPVRGRDLFLKSSGGRNLTSPAGLIYTMGGGGEHRVDHVMRHAVDDENRPVHGVFEGDEESILRLIDEAYLLVQEGSSRVQSEDSDGNAVYTVSLQRRIGYEGGQRGARNGNRPLTRLRLVLQENRVITAYPYR